MRRSTLKSTPLAAGLVAAVLTLSACSSDAEEPQATPTPDATETPAEPDTWPLTGLEVADGESSEQERPVVVVKIDNSGAATQAGVSQADLVFEQLVEGGTTRLAAFYYSQTPDVVGPVRSMRATDVGIVGASGAHVVTSGAAIPTIERINAAGITFHEEGATGIFRDSARRAPYNLMANLTELTAAVKTDAARPSDYFVFGDGSEFTDAARTKGLVAKFGNHSTEWVYSKGTWTIVDDNAAEGDTFAADTVLTLEVEVADAGYKDPSGAFVPESVFEGTGEAHVFHDGKVLEGVWKKDGLDGALTLEAADGTEIKVPAGRTWVELVPTTGDVTFATVGKKPAAQTDAP